MGSNPAGVTSRQATRNIPIARTLNSGIPLTLAIAAALTLGACASGGGGAGLSGGLTARMDQPGATLNKAEALGILNAYRSTQNVPALVGDSGLDAAAQGLAAEYARSGQPPRTPPGAVAIRVSAGYANFAETFSGWRNSPPDAQAIADPAARRAGLAVSYDANSTYGVYWVLVLDD